MYRSVGNVKNMLNFLSSHFLVKASGKITLFRNIVYQQISGFENPVPHRPHLSNSANFSRLVGVYHSELLLHQDWFGRQMQALPFQIYAQNAAF